MYILWKNHQFKYIKRHSALVEVTEIIVNKL